MLPVALVFPPEPVDSSSRWAKRSLFTGKKSRQVYQQSYNNADLLDLYTSTAAFTFLCTGCLCSWIILQIALLFCIINWLRFHFDCHTKLMEQCNFQLDKNGPMEISFISLFSADILTCVTNSINNGSVLCNCPSRLWKCASKPAWMIPGSRNWSHYS